MARTIRVLAIGHSYAIALNRAIVARVARDPEFAVTVAGPSNFHGDLRPLTLEPDPQPEAFELVGLPTQLSKVIHVFRYRHLRRLIRPGRFDVVYIWQEPYIYSGFQIARACVSARVPYVFFTYQNLDKSYPPPFAQFERYVVRHAAGWLAGGELVHSTLLGRGYPEANSGVITAAVDESAFRPDPEAGAEVRRALGLAGPVIGFVGRLNESKGLDVLMAALERVPPPWSLLAIGSGPYAEKVRGWAESRGLGDRVRVLLAKHDEVPRYVNAMDLLVAPSQTMPNWKEQFGRMLIEAFACKVPVIGSDSGEIPLVIGDAGLVVGEKDVEGWTRAITDLLASESRRRELGQAGYDRCQARYTTAVVAGQFKEMLRRYARVGEDRPAATA